MIGGRCSAMMRCIVVFLRQPHQIPLKCFGRIRLVLSSLLHLRSPMDASTSDHGIAASIALTWTAEIFYGIIQQAVKSHRPLQWPMGKCMSVHRTPICIVWMRSMVHCSGILRQVFWLKPPRLLLMIQFFLVRVMDRCIV